MAGKTQALSKGKSAVKAKAKVKSKPKAKAVRAVAVAEPEPAASVDILEQAEKIAMADTPANLETDAPSQPEEVATAELTSGPDQTGNNGIPPVRPEWVGRVCCGLAVRAYSQSASKAPIGMSCEVHGSRYYITADNVPLP